MITLSQIPNVDCN